MIKVEAWQGKLLVCCGSLIIGCILNDINKYYPKPESVMLILFIGIAILIWGLLE